MKTIKNKTMTIIIAIFLMLSMAASTMFIPNTNAHTPPEYIPTQTYINVGGPNPIGVGQEVVILMWSNFIPPTATGANGYNWIFYLNITGPNGVTTKLGPLQGDDTGSYDYRWIAPATTGNYTFQAIFPTQQVTNVNPPPYPNGVPWIGDWFTSSASSTFVMTVQTAQVSTYPGTPPPSSDTYWQSPVNGMNKAWSSLNGNWLFANYNGSALNFNPYTTGPSSAHILWTKPLQLGGQLGGSYMGGGNEQTIYDGVDQYSPGFSPGIVIDGNLYTNEYTLETGLPGILCINLRTGATNWIATGDPKPVTTALSLNQPGVVFDNDTFNRLTYGEVLNYVSPNEYGGNAFLWAINGVSGTLRYDLYDASTGAYMLSMDNCTVGTSTAYTTDPNGALLAYVIGYSAVNGKSWLALWNSSLVTGMLGGTSGSPAWLLRPHTGWTLNWRTGVQWNVTEPTYQLPYPEAISKVVDDQSGVPIVLATTMVTYGSTPQSWVMDIAYNGNTGAQLYALNRTLNGPTELYSTYWTGPPAGDGIFTHLDQHDLTLTAYSLDSGQVVWSNNVFANESLNYYGAVFSMAYGYYYVASYSGFVYCLNATTGKTVWIWNTGSAGYAEWPGGTNWPVDIYSGHGVGFAVGGGLIYLSTGHSYNPPMFNGAQMYCLNATTGSLVYSVRGWWLQTVLADGVLVSLNGYDNQLYSFGKGLSATTVTTAPAVNNNGQVLISGTVTDQSPGQTCLGIPEAGTAAIGDAYMSQWMAYLFEQQPEPMNATGVPVTLTYKDPNNNSYTIGTTTSDINGQYTYKFTPTIPGEYTITATFCGSNSYYPSTAETHVIWDTPAKAAATPTPAPASVVNTYFVPAVIAIIIVIIIVGAVLAILTIRKRP